MVRLYVLASVIGACLLAGPSSASAQQVAVQQPFVGAVQVRSAVVVPDRGAAYLGGVRGAASGRTVVGPFRPGTALEATRGASSVSVRVYVHDLREMDEALLAAAKSPPQPKIDARIVERLEQRRRSSGTAKAPR